MKEYILTQPYGNLDEMLNSVEVSIYKEELTQGNIEQYAIVSRIGNRYDLHGNKIEGFAKNPYLTGQKTEEETVIVEETIMSTRYQKIEELINEEVAKEVAKRKDAFEVEVRLFREQYEQEISSLKAKHEEELAKVRDEVKAEFIARLTA